MDDDVDNVSEELEVTPETKVEAVDQGVSRALLPSWASSDWQLVGIVSVALIGTLFAFGGLYGIVLGLVAEGGTEAILPGLLVGVYFAFSIVGAESTATSAFSTAGDGVELSVGTRMVPLGLWVVFLYMVWRALKFCSARSGQSPTEAVGTVIKLALGVSVPLGILGAILTFDDTTSTTELTSEVSGGSAFLFSLLAVLGVGILHLGHESKLPLPVSFTDRVTGSTAVRSGLRSLGAGARAFAWMAATGSVVSIVAAVIVADDPAERILLVVAAPIYLINLGISAAVLFMGGSTSFAGVGTPDHISLLNFGFPPGPNGGTAPPYLFALLLIAPLLVARFTRRRLDSLEPSNDRDIVSTCFQAAMGFAATAWIAAGVAQFSVGGGSHDLARGFGSIDIEPSVSAALGFGLLWGLLGAFLAGIKWGRSRGLMQSFESLIPAIADKAVHESPAPVTNNDNSTGSNS